MFWTTTSFQTNLFFFQSECVFTKWTTLGNCHFQAHAIKPYQTRMITTDTHTHTYIIIIIIETCREQVVFWLSLSLSPSLSLSLSPPVPHSHHSLFDGVCFQYSHVLADFLFSVRPDFSWFGCCIPSVICCFRFSLLAWHIFLYQISYLYRQHISPQPVLVFPILFHFWLTVWCLACRFFQLIFLAIYEVCIRLNIS